MRTLALRSLWRLLTLAAFLLPSHPLPAQGAAATPVETLERSPAAGERCIVCDMILEEGEVVALRYRGQVVHVGAALLDEFLADPDRYIQKVQARSALFDGAGGGVGQWGGGGWRWFQLYGLVGILSAAVAAYGAISKGLPALPWFGAALLFNFLALIALFAAPDRSADSAFAGMPAGLRKVPSTHGPALCGACGASNHPSASRCHSCGADLQAAYDSEARRILGGEEARR